MNRDFMAIMLLVTLSFGIGLGFGSLLGDAVKTAAVEKELLERGLALYCPKDGNFAFVGECD